MPKLNQIVAIEKGIKTKEHQEVTSLYRQLEKMPLLDGLSRTYQPKEEDGEVYPPEVKRVQNRASDLWASMRREVTALTDVTATKEWANCEAKADVTVDGKVLMAAVPVSYLLFLEKKLVELADFARHLPTLDPAETWTLDTNQALYATAPVQTASKKKVPKVLEKAPATDKHPAQVEVYQEDVIVGYWTQVKFSGALPVTTVKELLSRIEKLQHAVKFAREQANSIEVKEQKVGEALFDYLGVV